MRQGLHRADKRRGLLNVGETALKALFGTATISDLHTVHETLDKSQEKQVDISQVVAQQLTYINGYMKLMNFMPRLLLIYPVL